MNKIKQAMMQARSEGILKKAPVTSTAPKEMHNHDKDETAAPQHLMHSLQVMTLDKAALEKNLVYASSRVNRFSMAYKMLRTQVLQKLSKNDWRLLGVSSARSSEGKSLTTLNLGFSLAQAAQIPVIIVDLDLRKPSLHEKLGMQVSGGVGDYLTGARELKDVLVRLGENLLFLPGSTSLAESSELISSARMLRMMQELIDGVGDAIVLFDLPPVLVVDDVLALAPYLDSCLLVVEEGKTTREDLKQSVALLETTELMGIVLNKSGEQSTSHYYE